MTPEDLARQFDVSRETLDKLKIYADLLQKWQKRINLVSKSTLPNLWERHFLDSAQVFPHLPDASASILDLGTGAGFPGLVLSIMGAENVTLVDSDQRKCAFVREVARQTESSVTIFDRRIEELPAGLYDVVTSRACAPLDVLLELSASYRHSGTIGLFLKGRQYQEELTTALKSWNMAESLVKSLSDDEAVLLRLEGISHAESGRT